MSLNQVDRQILSLIQKDASLSTAEIADKVGLSQSPCWRQNLAFRTRRLYQRKSGNF